MNPFDRIENRFWLRSVLALFAVLFAGASCESQVDLRDRPDATVSDQSDLKGPKQPTESTKGPKFPTIDKLLKEAVDAGKVIGHNALVFQDGKEIYYQQAGFRNARKELPLQRDTIFRIYSMSKPITSVAVMQLVESRKIKLDAPISTYLPELAEMQVLQNGKLVAARREMTTRDLLRHTSGLTYGFFGNSKIDIEYRNKGILLLDENVEQMVTKLSKIPLLNQPGKKFHYGVSTDVLGRVVEVASGERFDDYLKKHIFDPLKMEDTFFTVPDDKQDRFAEIYSGRDGKLKPNNPISSIRFVNENDFDSGGGGLCSTIDDYLKFANMLNDYGTVDGVKLLEKESVEMMLTNQLGEVDQNSPAFQFGLGFRCFPEGDFGWGGAAGTRFWINPSKKLVILYMVQISPYGGRKWGERVRSEFYKAAK